VAGASWRALAAIRLIVSYLYIKNVSPQDRFDQITIESDSGSLITLRKGNAYTLSATEITKARRFIELIDSSQVPTPIDPGGSSGGGGGVIVTPPGSSAPSTVSYKVWIERLV
jgi:hypothetical protein